MHDVPHEEITKLRDYLIDNNIGHTLIAWESGRYNIHIVNDNDFTRSFLTSVGSYGGIEGLIEYYDFMNEPIGWLKADEAIEIVGGWNEKR